MSTAFDAYDTAYGAAVEDSIAFSGLKHDFFLKAKVVVLLEELARLGLDPGELRALDVGCGVGKLHRWLAPAFARLEGVDPSAPCIEQARSQHPSVAYASAPPGRLPYDDGAFDVALSSCVLHHVPVTERQGFASELRRVLRPGGMACITEHNPFNPLTRLSVLRCPFDADAVLLRDKSAERLLRTAGFAGARSRHFLLSPWSHPGLKAVERALGRLPLGAQYATFAQA